MKKKARILAATYVIAAIVALGIYSGVCGSQLETHRLAAKYSSGRAFEETVTAVDALSAALKKSAYATDGAMCSLICGEAYADALAAETAMSALPFSTQELEQLSAFLNTAGDYAHSLCFEAAAEGFTEKQLDDLDNMSRKAAEFSEALRDMQGSVNSGDVIMDSRIARLANVGVDEGEKLSAKLLDYEAQFEPGGELEYDGKYSSKTKKDSGLRLTEEDMLRKAAEFAGVDKSELKKEYDYQGEDGRHCYSAGDVMICVSPTGVESMACSRLVSESSVSQEEAEQTAAEFLRSHGYEDVELISTKIYGAVARMEFARVENDAVCIDDTLTVAVALDDGSIYAFNAVEYSTEDTGAQWEIDEQQAAEKLPQGLKTQEMRKVIIETAGGRAMPCYEFSCTDKAQRQVKIYVDAQTGRQCRISVG